MQGRNVSLHPQGCRVLLPPFSDLPAGYCEENYTLNRSNRQYRGIFQTLSCLPVPIRSMLSQIVRHFARWNDHIRGRAFLLPFHSCKNTSSLRYPMGAGFATHPLSHSLIEHIFPNSSSFRYGQAIPRGIVSRNRPHNRT